MTERLDRIESLLLATAERQNEMNASLQQTQAVLNQTAQQQARNTDEIDTLLGAVSTNEVACRELRQSMTDANQRFEILRAEAAADRQRSDQRSQMLRAEANQRFEIFRAETAVDRQRSDQRFDAQIAEIRAQGEQIRALLSVLATTNGRVDTLEQAG